MKAIQSVIFLLIISSCFSQTKQQLINSIIKVNSLHSDCVGFGCTESEQYKNFQKLKKKLSANELIEFTKHKNVALRMYCSIEAIDVQKVNPLEIFSYELSKKDTVETFEGCIIDREPTYSKIYHHYWNKIRMEAYDKKPSEDGTSAMSKILETDVMMEKFDSLVIYSIDDINWLIYRRAFENRKHKDAYLPQIEKLAFEKNNSYAFEYLKNNYSPIYSEKISSYITNTFPKAEFKTENEMFYYNQYIKSILSFNNEKYNQIVLDKLRNDKSWKGYSDWFVNTLEEYNLKL